MGLKLILGKSQQTSGRQKEEGLKQDSTSPGLATNLLCSPGYSSASFSHWPNGPQGPVCSGISCPLSNLISCFFPSQGTDSSPTILPSSFRHPPHKHMLALEPFHLLFSQSEIIFLLRKVSPWELFNPLSLLIFLHNTNEMI